MRLVAPIVCITVLVAVIALVTVSLRDNPDDDATEPTATAQTPLTHHVQPVPPPEPTQVVEQKPPSIEEVTQIVSDRNDEGVKRLKAFEADGWEAVKVDDPPNDEVMQLSLNLIGNREQDLQVQIQSNSFTSEMYGRLTEIALTTQDDKTRYVALEALGRAGEKSAQLHLTHAFEQIEDEETRSQIIGYLIPAEPDDEIAIFLTEQIADPKISDRLKTQATFPLAMMSLLETSSPEEAMEFVSMEMPEEWKDNYSNIVKRLSTGGL